jgi:hypothetical protein
MTRKTSIAMAAAFGAILCAWRSGETAEDTLKKAAEKTQKALHATDAKSSQNGRCRRGRVSEGC